MRFLVTGASGFIGTPLSNALAQQFGLTNVQIMVLPEDRHAKERSRRQSLAEAGFDLVVCDIVSPPANILPQIKPFDVLFHLATFAETETNNKELNLVNDVGTEKLLQTLKPLLPGTRVVFTSSLAAVDRAFADDTPQDEDYPCTPRTPYGQAKRRAELILREHARQTGFEWTILRLPTVFGPNFRPGGLFTLIADSLRDGTLMARLNWPWKIGLVYVDEVVNALIVLATRQVGCNSLYHLSSDLAPTLDELIEHISRVLQVPRKRIRVPGFAWALMRKTVWLPGLLPLLPYKLHNTVWRLSMILTDGLVGNGQKFNDLVPLKFTSLEEGLKATYDKIPETTEHSVPPT
jgi:UDP-glucose 4-epimerase